MDDFSRLILSWKLQRDMTSDSFIEVVQDAVDLTGMTEVPLDDRTRAVVSLPNCRREGFSTWWPHQLPSHLFVADVDLLCDRYFRPMATHLPLAMNASGNSLHCFIPSLIACTAA